MSAYSLRGRLQSWLVIAIAEVWAGLAAVTYIDADREMNAVLDAHLAQSAQLLIAQSGLELKELGAPDLGEIVPYSQRVTFQIWDQAGRLILRSTDAPDTPLSTQDSGFVDSLVAGHRWRVFSGWNQDHSVLIKMAEERSARERLAARIAMNAILPLLVGLPLLAALISWIVRRATRPLVELGNEVGARSAATLHPIELPGIPREAAPLVGRLNELFGRVRQLLESERRFTANAAHELRNPLAALRAQAEVAAGSADPTVTRMALQRVILACDHLTRIVQQLLLLARVEEQSFEPRACRLDLLARQVLAEAAAQAVAKGIELTLDAAEAVPMQGQPELLEILLRNLIDNAIRHGGGEITVSVQVTRSSRGALLTVLDSGPGVEAQARTHLGQRFHRPEQTRADGSGLGLSIVQRIAEIHGGSVRYLEGPGGRGLQVQVAFPADGAHPISKS